MTLLIALLFAPAQAQNLAELLEGYPEGESFDGCLNSSCAERFYRFLTHSMIEQGFTMQQQALFTSALVNTGDGFTAGAILDTFPLTPPRENLSGKEEETDYSPVLPRIEAGWLGEVGPGRVGAGAFFLPPVPVQGASALIAGADLSFVMGEGPLRFGGELDYTFTRAKAAIVASEEQYENREAGGYENNLEPEIYEAVCAPAENGCIDVFTLNNVGLRAGVSYEVGAFTPYVKLGAAYLNEQLWVMYDDTLWGVFGIQGSAHVGSGLALGERAHLALGASTAYRPAAVSEDEQAGALFKLQGSAAYRF